MPPVIVHGPGCSEQRLASNWKEAREGDRRGFRVARASRSSAETDSESCSGIFVVLQRDCDGAAADDLKTFLADSLSRRSIAHPELRHVVFVTGFASLQRDALRAADAILSQALRRTTGTACFVFLAERPSDVPPKVRGTCAFARSTPESSRRETRPCSAIRVHHAIASALTSASDVCAVATLARADHALASGCARGCVENWLATRGSLREPTISDRRQERGATRAVRRTARQDRRTGRPAAGSGPTGNSPSDTGAGGASGCSPAR